MVTLPHIAQRRHAFSVKRKEKDKSKKVEPKNKSALELLHNILRKRSTGSFMAGGTANVWQDIEVRINTDPFFT